MELTAIKNFYDSLRVKFIDIMVQGMQDHYKNNNNNQISQAALTLF